LNKEKLMTKRAVSAGATGMIGSNLAEHLVGKGWEVYGIARKPQTCSPDYGASGSSRRDGRPTHRVVAESRSIPTET
jgi:nucleoside-diphosphate-sugar epimerase